jgi:hypothetical protein
MLWRLHEKSGRSATGLFKHWKSDVCRRRSCSKGSVAQSEVARQVGAHREPVSRWAQQLKQRGVHTLKKDARAGRQARLPAEGPEDPPCLRLLAIDGTLPAATILCNGQ